MPHGALNSSEINLEIPIGKCKNTKFKSKFVNNPRGVRFRSSPLQLRRCLTRDTILHRSSNTNGISSRHPYRCYKKKKKTFLANKIPNFQTRSGVESVEMALFSPCTRALRNIIIITT